MKKPGKAIQTILMKNKDKLFAMINDGASIAELQKVIDSYLDEAQASGNDSVPEARLYFAEAAKRGYNNYLSTLMTYLTGIAVGK